MHMILASLKRFGRIQPSETLYLLLGLEWEHIPYKEPREQFWINLAKQMTDCFKYLVMQKMYIDSWNKSQTIELTN